MTSVYLPRKRQAVRSGNVEVQKDAKPASNWVREKQKCFCCVGGNVKVEVVPLAGQLANHRMSHQRMVFDNQNGLHHRRISLISLAERVNVQNYTSCGAPAAGKLVPLIIR